MKQTNSMKSILSLIVVLALSTLSYGQIEIDHPKMVQSSEQIEEVARTPMYVMFPEIDVLNMRFETYTQIDTANWFPLEFYVLQDLDLLSDSIQKTYYGVGRYEFETSTYYFVAYPDPSGWWG